MSQGLDTIEVKHTNINKFWFYVITFIFLDILGNFLSAYIIAILSISSVIEYYLAFNIGVLVFETLIFYPLLPIVRVGFFVSNEYFKFDLQNKLFLKVFWRDITLLEIINIKWRYNGYKINYSKLNQTKTLRLFLLQFSKKKTTLILKLLKEFAEKANVNFKEGKKERDNSKDVWNDWIEVRKIIQSVKKLS